MGHGSSFHNLGQWLPKWAKTYDFKKRSSLPIRLESANMQTLKTAISENKALFQIGNIRNGLRDIFQIKNEPRTERLRTTNLKQDVNTVLSVVLQQLLDC